jgi:hypothetical protein
MPPFHPSSPFSITPGLVALQVAIWHVEDNMTLLQQMGVGCESASPKSRSATPALAETAVEQVLQASNIIREKGCYCF